jgi:3-deoxy-D-manno-octulosonate 8-phosphate phosphatase (KDO 8-P phosphatase)
MDPTDLEDRLARVRLLCMDVDGVLTDGAMWVSDDGSRLRRFHSRDGQGLKNLIASGVVVAWVSGDDAPAVRHRARWLGIPHLLQAVEDKGVAVRDLARQVGVGAEEVAFMGDDLPDLRAFVVAAVRIAPADAAPEVLAQADLVSRAAGGQGGRGPCGRCATGSGPPGRPGRATDAP